MFDMVEVIVTNDFEGWYKGLTEKERDDVARTVDVLEMHGVNLDHPYSSQIKGADFALRELRVRQGNSPLRVFYAFDPARQAVLLIAGDKSNDKRFYDRMIKASKRIWAEYLQETGQ